MLSLNEIEFYHENGYLVVENVLDTKTLKEAQNALADLIAGARGMEKHNDVYDLEPTHRPDDPRVRRIKTPHLHHEAFRKILGGKVLTILQQLLGPSVRLHGSKINIKAAHYGSPVEWHQDWAFYPHSNDDLLAIGVMMDDCALKNGPLLVIPGTHKGPTFDHHAEGYFCGAINPDDCALDFEKAVPLIGPAGSMSFHHVRLVHGSAQNLSDRPRQLLLYEIAAADAWPLRGVKDFNEYSDNLLAGESTIEPRIVPVPIRMPMPPALRQGSIYESQTVIKRRYFSTTSLTQ
jgi:phytanoyl-CoA hydroxylase